MHRYLRKAEGIISVGSMTEQRRPLIGDRNTITMLMIIALLITLTTSSIAVINDVIDAETKPPARLCSLGTCNVSALVQVHSSSLFRDGYNGTQCCHCQQSPSPRRRKYCGKVTGVLGNHSGLQTVGYHFRI